MDILLIDYKRDEVPFADCTRVCNGRTYIHVMYVNCIPLPQ